MLSAIAPDLENSEQRRHPLFLKKLLNLGLPWLGNLVNRFLSVGGMCYFINEDGIKTRVYIYNYFALLHGGPFRAKWVLRAYSQDGKRTLEKKGELYQSETISIEMGAFARELGPLGLCMVHLYPAEGGITIRNSYMTHFFIEYYTASSESLLHSLGHPVPKLHKVNDYITSSIQPGSDALLLVSNSCYRAFHYPKKLFTKGIRIGLTNARRQYRSFDLKPILPLATEKVDLRKEWPDLNDFLAGQPALLQICGPNVLYSPLVIQTNPNGSLALDHFQGGDWHDTDAVNVAC
jgi:hypothetical protein